MTEGQIRQTYARLEQALEEHRLFHACDHAFNLAYEICTPGVAQVGPVEQVEAMGIIRAEIHAGLRLIGSDFAAAKAHLGEAADLIASCYAAYCGILLGAFQAR